MQRLLHLGGQIAAGQRDLWRYVPKKSAEGAFICVPTGGTFRPRDRLSRRGCSAVAVSRLRHSGRGQPDADISRFGFDASHRTGMTVSYGSSLNSSLVHKAPFDIEIALRDLAHEDTA